MTVNAGARLDRLPISSFHRRILALIGVPGVLSPIIVLLVVQIIVVLIYGVEPRKRRLEEMESGTSDSFSPSGA